MEYAHQQAHPGHVFQSIAQFLSDRHFAEAEEERLQQDSRLVEMFAQAAMWDRARIEGVVKAGRTLHVDALHSRLSPIDPDSIDPLQQGLARARSFMLSTYLVEVIFVLSSLNTGRLKSESQRRLCTLDFSTHITRLYTFLGWGL